MPKNIRSSMIGFEAQSNYHWYLMYAIVVMSIVFDGGPNG